MAADKIMRKRISFLITGFAAFIFVLFKRIFPDIAVSVFSMPAAKLSSLFMGAPYVRTDGLTFTLYPAGGVLRIIESCSGFDFWLILFLFFAYRILNIFPARKALACCVLLAPVSFVVSVLINTSRIIASWYISGLGKGILSAKFADVAHLWTGIIIFLSSMIVIYILFQRRLENEA